MGTLADAYRQAAATPGYAGVGFTAKDVAEYNAPKVGTTTQPITTSMTPQQIKDQLQKQLPQGAEITWFAETTPGQYSVSYNMPKEPAQQQTMIRADLSGPFRDWFGNLISAPTVAELNAQMQANLAGSAIPIKTEEVFAAATVIGFAVAPILQKHLEPLETKIWQRLPSKIRYGYYGLESTVKADIHSITRPISTFYYKHLTTMGRWESEFLKDLSWAGEAKGAAFGFQKAFPSDIAVGSYSYTSYPGFEFWAGIKEAPKFIGYPTLRPLSAVMTLQAKRKIEQNLFMGRFSDVFPIEKQLQAWEVFTGTKEVHPYVGQPVYYGPIVGVKLATGESAWEQILKGIEKGMFPRMGGLAAVQIPTFARSYYDVGRQLSFPQQYGKNSVTQIMAPLVETGRRTRSILEPLLPLPVGLSDFEFLKQKFANITVLKPKQKEETKQVAIPSILAKTRQRERQILTVPNLMMPPEITTTTILPKIPEPSTIPSIPIPAPFAWPLGGGGDSGEGPESLYGRWFKKPQLIKTPKQMLETFFGTPAKKSKGK